MPCKEGVWQFLHTTVEGGFYGLTLTHVSGEWQVRMIGGFHYDPPFVTSFESPSRERAESWLRERVSDITESGWRLNETFGLATVISIGASFAPGEVDCTWSLQRSRGSGRLTFNLCRPNDHGTIVASLAHGPSEVGEAGDVRFYTVERAKALAWIIARGGQLAEDDWFLSAFNGQEPRQGDAIWLVQHAE